MLAPITNRSRMLMNRLRRQSPLAVEASHAVYYTRGDSLLSPGDYRRSFESDLQRAMSGNVSVSDETAANAYAISATANACTEKRATMTAGIPAKVVDAQGDDIEDTELSYFVSNAAHTFALCVRSALIYGRVYLRKRRNTEGYPVGLEWIDPTRVREMPDSNGKISAYGIRDITYWGMGAEEEVAAKEVIYFQMFDTNPAGNGLSKYEAAFRSLSVEGGIATHAAAFFLNRAAIDGMLTFDRALTDPERKQAEETWRQFKGAKNAHRTAVMPGGATWTPVTAPPKDLAMGELDDKQVKKICAVFEVDPTLIGLEATSDPLGASSTFEAVEIAHIRNVAIPFLTMYVLPALNDQWARTDFSEPYTLVVDEANIAAYADANLLKSETAINLVAGGVIDYNEGRALLGQPERTDYIKRDTTQASRLWTDGVITLFQYLSLIGGPASPLPMDMMNVNGVGLVPITEVPTLWQKRLLIAPSVYNTPLITGEPLPQPTEPDTVIPTANNEQPGEIAEDSNALPGNSPATPALPATVSSEPTRAAQPLELALSFAGNAFIRYCRRALSEALTAQGIDAQWVSEDAWRLTLARADQWTPAAASNIIKASNYADTRPLDFTTAAFEQRDNAIYLTIAGDLSAMRQSARLDVEGANLDAQTPDLAGVLMCTTDGKPDLPTAESYPLVGNTVSLMRGSEPLHTWTLTGVSAARSKELQNWRSVAAKGKDFAPDVLRDSDVAAFVTDTLAAGVDVDDVFDMARDMLRGILTWRAYPETREAFVSEITGLFQAGATNETDRRAFSARLRALLRKFGLVAYRDGMESVNYSPESLSPDEVATFRNWQNEQSGYVTNLGAEIFKQGITENEVDLRVRMWADVSLADIHLRGVEAGNSEQRMMWIVNGEAEHCESCLSLSGQVHSIKAWRDKDLRPGAQTLICKQGCKCRLELTDKPQSGAFL